MPTPFLLVAQHAGPYLSIEPLGPEFGETQTAFLVDGAAREQRVRNNLPYIDGSQVIDKWGGFERLLVEGKVEAIIRSTSETSTPDSVEVLASRAAASLGIPVFVVEDFPGNYQPLLEEPLSGLFVEDESMVEFHQSKGVEQNKIFSTRNPRYARLQKVDREPVRVSTRDALGLGDEPIILWAGQPDGDNSYLTLQRLLGNYPKAAPTLLFRAHPRDQAYHDCKYESLIAAGPAKIIDVSDWPDNLALCCASDLVVTQFSSVAVEASYLGVPALFVLFEYLGRKSFKELKGYGQPVWCVEGCSFLIEREEEISKTMNSAIFNEDARSIVKTNFQRRFGSQNNSAKLIAERIKAMVNESSREVMKSR